MYVFAWGFIVGACPSIAMVAATYLLASIAVSSKLEAGLQNLAAGLILAAVGCELFPIMREGEGSVAGVTVGFVVGLITIYGVEYLVSILEEWPTNGDHTANGGSAATPRSRSKSVDDPSASLLKSLPKGFSDSSMVEMVQDYGTAPFEEKDVEIAFTAIRSSPAHKQHIQEHLEELLESIKFMEDRTKALSNPSLSVREVESIAESIDERIHTLQYKLDHARRLVQGSENDTAAQLSNRRLGPASSWVTDERKASIRKGLLGLRHSVEHLLEHLSEPELNPYILQEVRVHMDLMDRQISSFHESIERVGAKWSRLLPAIDPKEGDPLPMGLVLPVCVDAFVDGFLIGISVSISLKAGVILGCANCMEMSILGMAYASRLVKCTGSSPQALQLALYAPPLIMVLASGLGAAIGEAVQAIPVLFVGMVSFGCIALLSLVCNELLIEAREAQGDEDKWYISICVFIGVYLVLMLDHVV